MTTLRDWALSRLEATQGSNRILVRDPLHLLLEQDSICHDFGREHGYTVIWAATNLAFRELYERAVADVDVRKILVVDRAPARRRSAHSSVKAPPPFYPDFLAQTPEGARVDLDLREYLGQETGDSGWPLDTNEPRYARLIVRYLDGVVRAHANLRAAHPSRFTDHDFKTIVAFAALGIAESAFKRLGAEDYWKIGLLGHDTWVELDSLAPEVTSVIRDQLAKAPAPFCWFGQRDPDVLIRMFYLSVILAQHTPNWKLLLASVDPGLVSLANMDQAILQDAAPKLVALDREQAIRDLETVEDSLEPEALKLILLDHLGVTNPDGFASLIRNERYSTLFSSLALLLALDDILTSQPSWDKHEQITARLFPDKSSGPVSLTDIRPSHAWSNLKEAYKLAQDILPLRRELGAALKVLAVTKPQHLTFAPFQSLWNERKVNRLEYYLSAFERLVDNLELSPRTLNGLPLEFGAALQRIQHRARAVAEDTHRQLDELNGHYQTLVSLQYPSWVVQDSEVYLTSQFLRRCLKPNWDPSREKAVVFIFDGMRYDIWDELLRPMLLDRMELLHDLPATSLLPSETHITRKAISAGAYPDEFDTNVGEHRLLKDGLAREFGYRGDVEVLSPDNQGTGETVRYRAGNLDVFIFELCDKELHKIRVKTLPDGREVPSRPLAFIYQQTIKNIIDTEVLSIMRSLSPGTKVFIAADHGFGRVGRQQLWIDSHDCNSPQDCNYLNARLCVSIQRANMPGKVRANVIALTPEQLRMPRTFSYNQGGKVTTNRCESVIFPRATYAFNRPGSNFSPDAYSHGGISLQENVIPMVVLRVKSQDEGPLSLRPISGPTELVEGQEAEFRLLVVPTIGNRSYSGDLRVDVEATYSQKPERYSLSDQVVYVPPQGVEIVYRLKPDSAEASAEERDNGVMERILTVAVRYRVGGKTYRRPVTHRFRLRLSSEQIVRRVPTQLGNILGLTPKSIRG